MKNLALITGGTSGIGLGIAELLAQNNDIAIVYASDDEKANRALDKIITKNPETTVKLYKKQLHTYSDCEQLLSSVKSDFEQDISILINSLGRINDGAFLNMKFEEHKQLIESHLFPTMSLAHLVAKGMSKNRFGRIINLSSISATRAKIGQVAYATAKCAIEGFTRTFAIELAHRGVTVNAIAPGLISTPMTSDIIEKVKAANVNTRDLVPTGFIGEPDDIGHFVDFLCTEKSRYITGQTFVIDGGRSL